jgi:hypothetical protein
MKETIIDYIKKNIKKGYTIESLKYALLNQGYSRITIENSIKESQKEIAKKIPKLNEKPLIKYELYDSENKLIKKNKKSFFSKLFRL